MKSTGTLKVVVFQEGSKFCNLGNESFHLNKFIMSKEKRLADALAVIQEYVSDNNSEDSSQGGQNVGLALLLSALSNQSNDASSSLANSFRNLYGRSDEDVNATEILKAQGPAYNINMKNVVAAEYAKTLDFLTQNNQIAWNGITNANAQAVNMITQLNTVNQAAADNFGHHLAAKVRDLDQLMANPHYFAENAPATQDTGGEGDDTGDNNDTGGGQ